MAHSSNLVNDRRVVWHKSARRVAARRISAGRRLIGLLAVLATLICAPERSAVGQGVFSPGIGPVNRGMGGAAVAAPIDGISAIHWNPATLTRIRSSADLAFELPITETRVASTLPADALGPGAPPVTLSDATRSDAGVFPLFSNALVYSPEDRIWTLGFGMYTIGGLFTNFPATPTNPIVSPAPPNGFGTGATYSRLALFQMAPTVAFQISENLSFGIAPTFSTADLQLNPLTLAAPDDANGDGFATFPGGTNSRLHWGFGAQAGFFLTTDLGVNAGVSVKSPQWFERFTFNSADENGLPRTLTVDADLPLIASAGVAYEGLPGWLVAIDMRWTDYANTDGFKQTGFAPDGSARGIGWRSVLSVSTGVQFRPTEMLALRAGYFYTQNPIPDSRTSFNVAAPAFFQQIASVGATLDLGPAVAFSFAYYHSFENSISGPILTPGGAIPGSNIKISSYADSFAAGFTVRY
ncbi:MAG: outer membrane protein transport protein [Planctomycetales bacterium]|nr:outer membrane protein transport protein [Planctomycetales bacterium]MCA9227794.1 outer membrane protein transport protein [Planctomycetales bacterium]